MRISICQVYDRSASIYSERLGSYAASDSDCPEEDGSTTTDVCLRPRFKRVGSGC